MRRTLGVKQRGCVQTSAESKCIQPGNFKTFVKTKKKDLTFLALVNLHEV